MVTSQFDALKNTRGFFHFRQCQQPLGVVSIVLTSMAFKHVLVRLVSTEWRCSIPAGPLSVSDSKRAFVGSGSTRDRWTISVPLPLLSEIQDDRDRCGPQAPGAPRGNREDSGNRLLGNHF